MTVVTGTRTSCAGLKKMFVYVWFKKILISVRKCKIRIDVLYLIILTYCVWVYFFKKCTYSQYNVCFFKIFVNFRVILTICSDYHNTNRVRHAYSWFSIVDLAYFIIRSFFFFNFSTVFFRDNNNIWKTEF